MIDENILRKKYLDEEKSMNEIADELGVAVGSVYNYIKKYNIQSRPKMTNKTKNKISNSKKGKFSKLKGTKIPEERKEKLRIAKSGGVGKKQLHDGYYRIYFPDHPKSDSRGWILEHILIMECSIGRWLKDDEVVHHKNGIRNDNRIENLQLMTRSEHSKYHRLQKNWKEWWDINKIILSGNISTDIDLRQTTSGTPVAKFNLAVRGQKDTDFFPIITWNQSAENVNEYCEKGSKILVEGRIQNREYEKDGEKRHVTEIVADKIEYLSKTQNTQQEVKEDTNKPYLEFGNSIKTKSEIGEQLEIMDSDLPF